METLEAIMTTRAIRRFTSEPVSEDDLWTCLRAAQQAPSGGNAQPTRYVVVTDPVRRARIGELYRRAFTTYEATLPASDDPASLRTRTAARHLADHAHEVPVLVFFLMPVMERRGLDTGPLYASVYPAVQNFCIAARSLGLGTTLTTVIRVNEAEALAELGVTGYEIAALVPVGHPASRFGVAPRRDVGELTTWM